jgi:crotonobetainyl-CoA:carnitine CoA-transferase CaiB-like acyl-CoA transferase
MAYGGNFLSGTRILDFTSNVAGPNAVGLLGALGAEVVKVESRLRPDPVRRRLTDRPYLHGSFFEDMNTGKRCISLNMKSDAGRRLASDLVGQCDVLADSFRPGVMDRIGLGFEAVHARYPRVVVASLSATGTSGPLSGMPGYAGIFSAMGGLGGLTGYQDGPPTELRTSIDLRSGAMFAMMLAWSIGEARRTGQGSRVDFSSVEAVALMCGEYLTASLLGTAVSPQRIGNRDEQMVPHGIYPTAGDQWMALAVRTPAEWAALARLMQSHEIVAPEGWASQDARRAVISEVDDLVARWTRLHTQPVLDGLLREAGVPAGPVLDGQDLFREEHLRTTGFYQTVRDTETGQEQIALSPPWRVAGERPALGESSRIGEDTDAVLKELLGLSSAEIEQLQAAGALT